MRSFSAFLPSGLRSRRRRFFCCWRWDFCSPQNLFCEWMRSRDTVSDAHERCPSEPCSGATGRVPKPFCARSTKSQAVDISPNRFSVRHTVANYLWPTCGQLPVALRRVFVSTLVRHYTRLCAFLGGPFSVRWTACGERSFAKQHGTCRRGSRFAFGSMRRKDASSRMPRRRRSESAIWRCFLRPFFGSAPSRS